MKPTVGLGATYYCGSDRYPCTVIQVINDKRIVIMQHPGRIRSADKTDTYTVTLRKNGKWHRVGTKHYHTGYYVLGERDSYMDPSF